MVGGGSGGVLLKCAHYDKNCGSGFWIVEDGLSPHNIGDVQLKMMHVYVTLTYVSFHLNKCKKMLNSSLTPLKAQTRILLLTIEQPALGGGLRA